MQNIKEYIDDNWLDDFDMDSFRFCQHEQISCHIYLKSFEEYKLKDYIKRTFEGEIVLIQDIRVHLEKFWEWYNKRNDVGDGK